MSDLRIRIEPLTSSPGISIVVLHGAIDPKNVSTLERALESEKRQEGQGIILDLADVRYINSAGLAFLVTLSDDLAARGGRLELANAQPKVKLILEMMGLTEFFKLYKSCEAALSALRATRREAAPRSREEKSAPPRRSKVPR